MRGRSFRNGFRFLFALNDLKIRSIQGGGSPFICHRIINGIRDFLTVQNDKSYHAENKQHIMLPRKKLSLMPEQKISPQTADS